MTLAGAECVAHGTFRIVMHLTPCLLIVSDAVAATTDIVGLAQRDPA